MDNVDPPKKDLVRHGNGRKTSLRNALIQNAKFSLSNDPSWQRKAELGEV